MTPPLHEVQKKLLRSIYYDEKKYFGRDKLFAYLRDNYSNYEISRRQVQDWLNDQEVHQLYYKTRKRKTTTVVRPSKANQWIAIDLIDLTARETTDKYKWLFVAEDLYNKKAFALPMKDKTEKTVLATFKKIHNKIGKFSILRSDNDATFTANQFKGYIKGQGIRHIFSKAHTPSANGLIERLNKSIKSMIFKDIKLGNHNWANNISTFIENYNTTINRSTHKAPIDKGPITVIEKKQSIEKRFRVGQKVRVKLNKDNPLFYKGKESWSQETYKITSVFHSRTQNTATQYIISDGTKTKYFGTDLQPIISVHHKVENDYEISKLVKPLMRKGQKYYEVKWRNYQATTEEPRDEVIKDVPKLLKKYESEHSVSWLKGRVKYT